MRHIRYHARPEGYALPPRAPRRRGHVPARADGQGGQASLAAVEREALRRAAWEHPCPQCRAEPGQVCTRPGTWREGGGRQPVRFLAHSARTALVDAREWERVWPA